MPQHRFQFMAPESQRVRVQSSPEQRVRPASALRGSIQGGGVRAPTPVRPQIDRATTPNAKKVDTTTLNALQAMGNAIIDPMVQRKQEELFYEGARRQIEGEALQDIVSSQPWYSKVFGPSASIQGARTMAQMQAVEGFTTNLQNDMGTLRTLSPDEFQQELILRMGEAGDLGDHTSNVAVQSQLLESMGPLVRSQTKEHVAYVQEQMQQQFTGSLVSNARAMQSSAKGLLNGTMSKEDYNNVLANTESALHPIEGQSSDSYWAGVESATTEAMATGNFHFVNVVENALFEHMPIEQRTKFLADRRKFEIQTAADMSVGQFSVDIARLKAYSSEGLVSPSGTYENIRGLNTKFRQLTGIDRDLIDSGASEGILTNNLKGIISEQRKATAAAQTRADKESEIAGQVIAAKTAFLAGFGQSYVDQGGDRQLTQDTAWGALMQQRTLEAEGMLPQGTWAATAAHAENAEGFKVVQLERTLQRGIRQSIGEDYNPAFEQSYQMWRELYGAPGGESAAAAYAGEFAGQLEQYHNDRLGGFEDPAVAFAVNFRTFPSRTPGSVEQQKELYGWLQENHTNPGVFSQIMGASQPLNDSGQAVVASVVADSVAGLERSLVGLSQTAKFSRGYASSRPRVDIVGEHAYLKNPDDPRLKDYLAVTDEEAGLLFNETIASKSKAVGVASPESYQIIRLRDSGRGEDREPAFVVRVYDEDGVPATFNLRGSELRDRIGRSRPDPRVGDASPTNIPGIPLP